MMETSSGYFSSITKDFTKLSERFIAGKSATFDAFKNLWKDLSFDHLFTGRTSERDCRQFTEDCLKVAFNFCSPTYQPILRIFGLFSIFSVYHCNPFSIKVKVRILLQEWKDLLSFIDSTKAEIRYQQDDTTSSGSTASEQTAHLYDGIYIFEELRKARAFVVTVTKSLLHPAMKQLAESEMEQQRTEYILNRRTISGIFNTDGMDELSAILTEYDLQKKMLCHGLPQGQSLNTFGSDMEQMINNVLKKHEDWKKLKAYKKGEPKKHRNENKPADMDVESGTDQGSLPDERNLEERRAEIRLRAARSTPLYSKFGKQQTTSRDKSNEENNTKDESQSNNKRRVSSNNNKAIKSTKQLNKETTRSENTKQLQKDTETRKSWESPSSINNDEAADDDDDDEIEDPTSMLERLNDTSKTINSSKSKSKLHKRKSRTTNDDDDDGDDSSQPKKKKSDNTDSDNDDDDDDDDKEGDTIVYVEELRRNS